MASVVSDCRRLLYNESLRSDTNTVGTDVQKRAEAVMGIKNSYSKFTVD